MRLVKARRHARLPPDPQTYRIRDPRPPPPVSAFPGSERRTHTERGAGKHPRTCGVSAADIGFSARHLLCKSSARQKSYAPALPLSRPPGTAP
ncbi:hypothetical protein GCM10010498_51210 [Streptomyces cavourensis]|nr:hypothetical protein GCM10010498_51210 [Streptomyces cavourensis]